MKRKGKKAMDEGEERMEKVDGDAVEMRLADLPFEQIRDGKKTVEVRLYDEKRRRIRVGDTVLFYRMDRSERICARVKALYRAATFAELFAMPNMLKKAGFSDMPPSNAVDRMYQYYSAEQERRYGVLGIELCDLKWSKGDGNT